MDHHMFTADHLKIQCYHCGEFFHNDRWKSEFIEDYHYKSIQCRCGKKLTMKVDFMGSGHDKWDVTFRKTALENLIENERNQ